MTLRSHDDVKKYFTKFHYSHFVCMCVHAMGVHQSIIWFFEGGGLNHKINHKLITSIDRSSLEINQIKLKINQYLNERRPDVYGCVLCLSEYKISIPSLAHVMNTFYIDSFHIHTASSAKPIKFHK